MMLQRSQSNQSNTKHRPSREHAKKRDDDERKSEESLDFVQALNTALCYLCWTNADSSVIDSFLRKYPEALLLEGTTNDDARSLVEQRMRRCTCSDSWCNDNRNEILQHLDRGFQHYQSKHMKHLIARGKGNKKEPLDQVIEKLKSTFLFPQLMTSGRYLRGLSAEESSVRSQVLSDHVSKLVIEQDVKDLRVSVEKRTPRSRVRSLFACSGAERSKDQSLLLSKLELELQVAEMKLANARKEHQLLIDAIDRGQRNQYVLLRNAFEGCHKFQCSSQDAESNESLFK
ncbi:expressed unknown protein [Seminavis robusta]|uniref:Uncharacterized protein n=1 Tax=Seminavis robusta TaxID=568900 RepID=A0A9N8D8T6_9STRA|nr:expressed unknown protein [Seminavis robusta]|eukprot:Sro4_g003090.1 n/a (287) ;mRNA; r:43711-44571